MSTALIANEVARFLSSEEPEVICISGHWGVGKTYAWNKYLIDAKGRNAIALQRYSYISLFGVNSLDEFKYAIFENTIQSSEVGVEPSLKTLQTNTIAAMEGLGRKFVWFLQQLPWVRNHIGGLGPVWFLSVKNTIVCVDDIERRGKGLSVRDIMGLVSNLREHKGCKVLLILNDEALDEDKKDFDTYYEKVVDTSLKFAPTPQEAAGIALATETQTGMFLAKCCITLGISNIRLVKKIERSVSKIEPMLKAFDQQVLRNAMQSLTLFSWSVYEPRKAPSLEYLRKRTPAELYAANKNENIPENEASWNALLEAYGFTHTDEFDLMLLQGVCDGFFDPSLVQKHASELNDQIQAGALDNSFKQSWRLFHDSFADNQEVVLDAIYESFLKNVKNISSLDLNATVTLLKDLGRRDQAAEVIQLYVTIHADDRKVFDLENYPFTEKINDSDVIETFKEKFASYADERNPADILLSIAHGWSTDDIKFLSRLSADEYYAIFKKREADDLHKIISGCLQFDRIDGASTPMREIAKRAKEALTRIGQESPINARRVMKYGIKVDREASANRPSTGAAAIDAPLEN